MRVVIQQLLGKQQAADFNLRELGERFLELDQGFHALGARFDGMESGIRELFKGKGTVGEGGDWKAIGKETSGAKEGERGG
ncbi:unnamed protein product [Linum trigynum]|uniref:Uncharacterized protein n=1 Tax=Linum trigynum TaxID=586398 RepID=A0AAV2FA13_9ROSI